MFAQLDEPPESCQILDKFLESLSNSTSCSREWPVIFGQRGISEEHLRYVSKDLIWLSSVV